MSKKLALKKSKMRKLYKELDKLRPKTRADCANVSRPCIFVSCRHNTFLDINPASGKLKILHDECESPLDMKYKNCVLDIVEETPIMTLEDIGRIMNVTRERVRQIADAGVRKIRSASVSDQE